MKTEGIGMKTFDEVGKRKKNFGQIFIKHKKWVSLNSKYRAVILTFGVHFYIIISNKYVYINYIRRLIKSLNYILYKMSDKQM